MFLEQVAERLQQSQLGMGRTEENDEDEEDEDQQPVPVRPPPAMRSSVHQQENKMDYCFSDCESRPHNRPAMERLVQQLVDSSNKGTSGQSQSACTAGESRKKRHVKKRAAPRRSVIDQPIAEGSVGLRSLTISNRQPRNIRSNAIVRPYRPFTCFGDESFGAGAAAAAGEPFNREQSSVPPASDSRDQSVEASDYSSDEDYEPLIELVPGQEPEPDLLALRRQQLLFIKGKSEPLPELAHSDDEGAANAAGHIVAAAAEQSSDEEQPSAPQFEAIFSDAEEPSATQSGESDREMIDEEGEQVEEAGEEEAAEQDEVLELDAELDANRALSKTNCLNRKSSAPVARPNQLHSPVKKCSSVAPTGSTPRERDDIIVVESHSEIAHKTCEAVSSTRFN